MEEVWQEALSGFDAVWQRVQGEELPAPPTQSEPLGETALLEGLLQRMAETAAAYRSANGREAEPLRRLAAQCRQDLQRLRAEYFLRSGETFVIPPAGQPEKSLPALLRRAWHAERDLTEALRAAELRGLGPLCGEMAERSRQRREQVFDLLCRVLH